MEDSKETIDQNLADSIAMLEQILEVMPNDSDALKALYSAYNKVGESAKAVEYLNRIIDVYVNNDEKSLLPFIRDQLALHETEYPSEVAAQKARLRMVADSEPVSGNAAEPERRSTQDFSSSRKKEVDISEELALAWRLYEENQLSQEEYSSVLHDLTEVSSKELDVPVSVLHVLNDRGFTQMNRIMNYLSSRSGVPGIILSCYEISEEVAQALPLEFAAHDGALPFAFLGTDLLVAVLNPFNNALVEKMESASGHRCHTYLVEPEDYDLALARLRAQVAKTNPSVQP